MKTATILDFLYDVLAIDEIEVTTALTKENGFEPIDIAKLVIALEKEYNIIIFDEHVSLFNTVGDIIDYVKQNLPEPKFSPEQLIYESSKSIAKNKRNGN